MLNEVFITTSERQVKFIFHKKGLKPGLTFFNSLTKRPQEGSDERQQYSQAYSPNDATLIVMNRYKRFKECSKKYL